MSIKLRRNEANQFKDLKKGDLKNIIENWIKSSVNKSVLMNTFREASLIL